MRVVLKDHERPFADVLAEHSRDADLTVIGMQRPARTDAEATDGEDAYGEGLNQLVRAAGTTLLVHNGAPHEASLNA